MFPVQSKLIALDKNHPGCLRIFATRAVYLYCFVEYVFVNKLIGNDISVGINLRDAVTVGNTALSVLHLVELL